MATLVAQIDNFSPLWEEFEKVVNEKTSNEIHDWLLDNAPCDHETVPTDEIFDDVILQDAEWMVTYRDLMCDSVYLYEFS